MYCKKCGTKNKTDAKFCCKCGELLETKSWDDVEVEVKNGISNQSTKRFGKTIGLLIAVAVIGAAGTVVYKVEREKAYETYVAGAEKYTKQGEYELAKESYLKAIKIHSKEADLYSKLGDTYYHLGRLDEATKNYNKLLDIEAGSSDAYKGLLKIAYTNNIYEKIPELCEEAMSVVSKEEKQYFETIDKVYEDYLRYNAYDDYLLHTLGSRGSGCTYTSLDQRIITYGTSFLQLLDFDGDGRDEFIVVRTASEYDADNLPMTITDYVLEIYQYKNAAVEKIYEGEPFSYNGDGRSVVLAENEGKWYLKTGETDANMDVTYYGMKNGEFVPITTLSVDLVTLSRKINGKEATQEEWDSISQKYGNQKSYVIQGYVTDYNTLLARDMANAGEGKVGYKRTYSTEMLREKIMGDDIEKEIEGVLPVGGYIYEDDYTKWYVSSRIEADGYGLHLFCMWDDGKEIYADSESLHFLFDEETGNYECTTDYQSVPQPELKIEPTEKGVNITLSGGTLEVDNISASLIRDMSY